MKIRNRLAHAGAAGFSEPFRADKSPQPSRVQSRSSVSPKPGTGEEAGKQAQKSMTEESGKDPKNGGTRKRRPKAARILLWMLRKSIVPVICLIALIGGLYLGYVTFGKGPEADVWQWSTWRHMYDLIFSNS
jgi:hypothetical protein